MGQLYMITCLLLTTAVVSSCNGGNPNLNNGSSNNAQKQLTSSNKTTTQIKNVTSSKLLTNSNKDLLNQNVNTSSLILLACLFDNKFNQTSLENNIINNELQSKFLNLKTNLLLSRYIDTKYCGNPLFKNEFNNNMTLVQQGSIPSTSNNIIATSIAFSKNHDLFIASLNSGGKLSVKKMIDANNWIQLGSDIPYHIEDKHLTTSELPHTISLAVTQEGIPYVSIKTKPHELRIAKFEKNINDWAFIGGINSFETPSDDFVDRLVIAPDNTIYVAYSNYENGAHNRLTVKKFNEISKNWEYVGAQALSPLSVNLENAFDIAISKNGIPYIAYPNEPQNKIEIKQFNEQLNSWELTGNAININVPLEINLTTTSDTLTKKDIVFVASKDSYNNKLIMKFDASTSKEWSSLTSSQISYDFNATNILLSLNEFLENSKISLSFTSKDNKHFTQHI